MSILDNYVPVTQIGNSSTVNFSFLWDYLDESYLVVNLQDKDTGVKTLQTLGVEFTFASAASGGVVTFASAPSDQYYVTIERDIVEQMTTPYSTTVGFNGSVTELDFSRVVGMIQERKEEQGRTATGNIVESDGVSFELPKAVADYYVGWNSGATGFVNLPAPVYTGTEYDGAIGVGLGADLPAVPAKNDQYWAIDTRITYFCTSAGIWQYSKTIYDLLLAHNLTVNNDASIAGDLDVTEDVKIGGAVTGYSFKAVLGTSITEFSTDVNLSGISDNAVPTELAVKTYVDAQGIGTIASDSVATASSTSTTYEDIGADVSVTPSSITKAVRVVMMGTMSHNAADYLGTVALQIGAASEINPVTFIVTNSGASDNDVPFSIEHVYVPGVTTAQAISGRFKVENASLTLTVENVKMYAYEM